MSLILLTKHHPKGKCLTVLRQYIFIRLHFKDYLKVSL
nr:MAG TPA: hypothetical protein [Caudoviricetes sp.]